MWWRKTRLVRLYEELEILAILNRLVHDSHANSDRGDTDIHIFRERRQSEVLAEIAKLEGRQAEVSKGYFAIAVGTHVVRSDDNPRLLL